VPDEHESGGEEPKLEIIVQPEQLAGVWANEARVGWSEHEFTIDFVRLDPFQPRGIIVARVSGSAAFVMQLIEMLRAVWHDWARKAMPPEVEGGHGEEVPGDG
jgi:hypothetical protein